MSREGNLKGVERESLVIGELARMGWETFSGNGCTSCDIIAMKDEALLRIEVTGVKGQRAHPSGPYYSKRGGNPDCREFDILVRFNKEGEMLWQRSIQYKGSAFNLPLREEYSPSTTKKNLSRAQVLEKRCLTLPS